MSDNPLPAAQYLRMSTERQEYSLDNQATVIKHYADAHGLAILRTYSDAGRSGLVLNERRGLQALLRDVVGGVANYCAILVYDVSRWGRFQDADEAGHYEFLCKRAGIPVHYCAEPFTNDGTLPSSILKALKRAMAAEYSRELGVKCFAGQKRIAQLGYRMGAPAGYGLRRMAISSDGKRRRMLELGEYKSLTTDRVTLVPGPKKEVSCVREIYAMALHKRFSHIVRDLNARGVPYLHGRKWTWYGVSGILTNPKYCGCHTWARTTHKLHQGAVRRVPSEEWVTTPNAFPAIVDRDTFDRVQAAHRKRKAKKSNEQMLERLANLLAREGKITADRLNNKNGVPAKSTCVARFGGLTRLYELLGYRPSSRQVRVSVNGERTRRLRASLLRQIEDLFSGQVTRTAIPGNRRTGVQLKDGPTVSVLICGHYRTATEKFVRWELVPYNEERQMVSLVCLTNPKHDGFHHFYVFPRMDKLTEYQIRGEADPWLLRGVHLSSLDQYLRVAIAMAKANAQLVTLD